MAEEKPADKAGVGKKSGLGKYKWWLVGGGAVLLGIVFVAIRSANKNTAASSTSPTTAAQGGIDPATGYLYGSPADIAAGGSYGNSSAGVPGPAGPAGPAGPTGPAGPSGPAGASSLSTPTSAPPSPTSQWYTVKSGDNLTRIASQFGLGSWQNLYNLGNNKAAVGSNPNLIHPGLRLQV